MGVPIIGDLIESGINLINGISNKFAADQNIVVQNEADRVNLAARIKSELTIAYFKNILANKDLILKDLENARGHDIELAKLAPGPVRYITLLLSGLFRPIIGFVVVGSFAWARFLAPYWGYEQLTFDQKDYAVIILIVTFYYGGRTIEKIKGLKNPMV